MKRDSRGRFAQTWSQETKRSHRLSLTSEAWQLLEQRASQLGISRSEVVEQYARSLQDIDELDEQKQSERSLQQELEKYQKQQVRLEAILNFLPIPLMLVELETGLFPFSNQAAAEMAGQPLPEDMPAGTYNADYYCTDANGKMVPPEQLPALRIARGESIEGEELNWHTPSGVFPILVHGNVLPSVEGFPPVGVMVFQSIAERKKLEIELQHREQEFRTLAENAPDIIYRLDRNLRHVYVSPAITKVTGMTPEAFIGKTNAELGFPETVVDYWHQRVQQVLETGKETTSEFEWKTPEGVVYLQSQLVPEFGPNGIESILGITRNVTAYKTIEQALRNAEARLNLALAAARIVAWDWDIDTGEVICSENANQFWGMDREVGSKFLERIHPDDRDAVFQSYTRALEREEPFQVEYRVIKPNGQICWLTSQGTVYYGANGQPERLIGVAADISERVRVEDERKQAEEALKASETFYRMLGEAVPNFIWSCDATGKADFVNSRWIKYTGLTLEELNAGGLEQINHPEDYPILMQQWAEAAQTGAPLEAEFRYRRHDGEYRWFLGRSVPIKDANGRIQRWIGTTTDIHDRRQAEETLRQSEERLRIAQQAANAGVWDWDIITNQVTWSDEYYRLYGLDPTTIEASYENWLRSIVESDRDRTDQAVRDALRQQTNLNVEFRVLHPTLGERWLMAIGQTFYDHSGQPLRMTGIALDINHRKQTEKVLERYQLLAEYSRDIVLYFRSNGQILEANQAAVQAYGYDRAELLTLKIHDLRLPETLVHIPEQFEQASQQGILFETMHRRNDGSAFPVEVSAQSAVIGDEKLVLSIIRDITERKHAEAEREQLLLQEQATRQAAEAAEHRAEFLAAASETLASSLDYEYTLKSVAQAVVPTLADWCAVDILKDDGTLERLATAHVDPAKVQWGLELHRRYPPDLTAPHGIAQVLRTGHSEYYPTISDDQIVAAARDDEHLRILREIGFSSVMLVPLNARGRTLGTISFVATESERSYSPEDLSLAEELACRAAIALDNARLYQEAQHAQQIAERAADRTSRLQLVTAALSESLTPEQVAAVIVEQSMATLEATAALVVLVSSNRTELEIVKSVGYHADLVESWYRFSIDTDVPLAKAIRTGEPVWVETILDRIAQYPHLAEIYNRYEFNSWIALPLVVEGKSIGGILLSFTEFRLLNQDDRHFVLALTQQCAQAIVRAQLYEAERQARAEAEQANRIKDEFLAVLSHELRSPLNPILGWSRLLQTRSFDQAGTKRALKTIERNAKLQTQLIDDLLDVSRILRGKLVLNGCPTNLVNVIDAAFETVHLSAVAKGIDIQKVVEGEIGLTLGDAGRLQQVVWNLLSNAVKFTPEGGQIEIRLEQIGNNAQIQVKDTGKGINPEFLPHVFESFRQEDGATTRRFGGLGLGLAIVRHLVELHGGTVQVASLGEGQGALFTVRLPLLKDTDAQSETTALCDPLASTCRPLANVHVLVVDDESDSREFVAFVLKQAGATVLTATTAAEVLTQLLQSQPDVLLSDIGMPEMDGYMLMQQVRALPAEHGGQVPAIALTAYAGEIDQQQALAVGFQRHLTKPIEPEVLVSAIVALLYPT